MNTITDLTRDGLYSICSHLEPRSMSYLLGTCKKLNAFRQTALFQLLFIKSLGYQLDSSLTNGENYEAIKKLLQIKISWKTHFAHLKVPEAWECNPLDDVIGCERKKYSSKQEIPNYQSDSSATPSPEKPRKRKHDALFFEGPYKPKFTLSTCNSIVKLEQEGFYSLLFPFNKYQIQITKNAIHHADHTNTIEKSADLIEVGLKLDKHSTVFIAILQDCHLGLALSTRYTEEFLYVDPLQMKYLILFDFDTLTILDCFSLEAIVPNEERCFEKFTLDSGHIEFTSFRSAEQIENFNFYVAQEKK